MKVVVNALTAHGTEHGVGRYLLNLVAELASSDDGTEYAVLVTSETREAFERATRGKVDIVTRDMPRVVRLLYEHFALPLWLRREHVDVYLGATHVLPLLKTTREVVTIHDMSWFTVGRFHSGAKRLYFRLLIPYSLWRADSVLVDSESTRRDVVAFLGGEREDKQIVSAPLGVDSSFRPALDEEVRAARARFGLGRPFILNVGVIEPRKNQAGLIRAYRKLLEGAASLDTDLVIVGSKVHGWNSEEVFQLADDPMLKGRVHLLGTVVDEELIALMTGCTVFAYPSFYEGFGLPVLEAMACGAPVVTSDISSMPEVGGNAAVYVDPNDVDAIASTLEALLSDERRRDEMSVLGRARAMSFSWRACAEHSIVAFEFAYARGAPMVGAG
jgi:glycosyltransferase involved in cell wall biosynthesis